MTHYEQARLGEETPKQKHLASGVGVFGLLKMSIYF